MEETCSYCNKKTSYLRAVEVKTLSFNTNHQVAKPQTKPICTQCEKELKGFELSWEVLSH